MHAPLVAKRALPAAFSLLGLALPAQHDVYVANSGANTVSVLDTSSDSVAGTIVVGGGPMGVVVATDGRRAFVANRTPPSVSVIDTATRSVVATIPIAINPYAMAITPNGARLFVTHSQPALLTVIDTIANAVATTITPAATTPNAIAMHPDGDRAYIATESGQLLVLDTRTGAVATTLPAGRSFGLALSPDGSRLYAVHDLACLVSVWDTATNALVTTIVLGPPATDLPIGAAVSPDGSRLFVTIPNEIRQSGTITAVFADATVLAIDTATNAILRSFFVGLRPMRALVRPDGARCYVTNSSSGSVSVVDVAQSAVVATIAVGTSPQGIALLPEPFHPPGCAGSNGLVPRLTALPANVRDGSTVTFALDRATGPTTAIFAFGFSATHWAGGALPFDLRALGLPASCRLHIDPELLQNVAVSAAGTASLPVPLPPGLPPGLTFFSQVGVVDAGTGNLAVVSNALSTTIVR